MLSFIYFNVTNQTASDQHVQVTLELPAYSRGRMSLLPNAGQQSIDIFCVPGAQQRTAAATYGRRMMGQTDGRSTVA